MKEHQPNIFSLPLIDHRKDADLTDSGDKRVVRFGAITEGEGILKHEDASVEEQLGRHGPALFTNRRRDVEVLAPPHWMALLVLQ